MAEKKVPTKPILIVAEDVEDARADAFDFHTTDGASGGPGYSGIYHVSTVTHTADNEVGDWRKATTEPSSDSVLLPEVPDEFATIFDV